MDYVRKLRQTTNICAPSGDVLSDPAVGIRRQASRLSYSAKSGEDQLGVRALELEALQTQLLHYDAERPETQRAGAPLRLLDHDGLEVGRGTHEPGAGAVDGGSQVRGERTRHVLVGVDVGRRRQHGVQRGSFREEVPAEPPVGGA